MPAAALIPALASAAAGGISGALANQKQGGRNADNYFSLLAPSAMADQVTKGQASMAQANQGQAAQDVMSNPLLSQAFGQGGLYSQAGQQVSDLMKSGYDLTPQDRTAYGQISGDIARQFGSSNQSLANALSQRGLSGSNVAAAKFSGQMGNQNEQLANLQTQIAQNRYQQNMQRLGQMQSFYNQLGAQAQSAMGQDINANLARGQAQANSGMEGLRGIQGQANEQLKQQQQTEGPSVASNIFGGLTQGFAKGASMGLFGGGGGGSLPTMAGQSSNTKMFA